MKKKVLITMTYMRLGGAERSLLGLLHSIDYTRFDVDLFLFWHIGEFLDQIPKEVNLLPEHQGYTALCKPLGQLKEEKKWFWWALKKMAVITAVLRYKLMRAPTNEYGITQYCSASIVPWLPMVSHRCYDLAISFISYHDVIIKKAIAKKRVGWFHTDFNIVKPFMKMDLEMWKRLDRCVNVSADAEKAFLAHHPSLQKQSLVIENILSPSFVREQAEATDVTDEMRQMPQLLNILTVGRFCEPKAFDRAIQACARLLKDGYELKWFAIGEGHLESCMRTLIKEHGVEKSFIILGKKVNPYPYFKGCDLYVQPSNYEGKSVTVREAQMFGKPVIITRYVTAASQVEDGVDGIICEMNVDGVVDAIKRMIADHELRQRISANCLARSYGNEAEIEKIYSLVETG